MMKEIGGYFEFENLINNEYYKDLKAFNSARSCLSFLILERKIKRILLPYYLCDVIYKACYKLNIEVKFYNIDDNFLPIVNIEEVNEYSYIYIVNYYGLISNKTLKALKEKYNFIIVDNTHAFFQSPIKNIDTIYNCRKYFGVPDGAYLSTDIPSNHDIKVGKSAHRFAHLIGRYENNASDYYNDFKKADASFDEEEILYMSKLTKNILSAIDYQKVKAIRRDNYKYIHNNLKSINKLSLDNEIHDFMYPLYVDNPDEVRERLIKNRVYVPILWPNVLKECDKETLEYKMANNIIPIPIDQRYNENDMLYILDLIFKYVGGKSEEN